MIIFFFFFFLKSNTLHQLIYQLFPFKCDVTLNFARIHYTICFRRSLFSFRNRKITTRSMDLEAKPQQEGFLELEESSSEKSNRRMLDGEESVDDEGNLIEPTRRTINLNEVAWHDTIDSCWIVIRDFVYDCTDFLKSHPGGSDVILEYAGRDATLAFIGTGHSSAAIHSLKRYLIGELPVEERIFRVPNGLKISSS